MSATAERSMVVASRSSSHRVYEEYNFDELRTRIQKIALPFAPNSPYVQSLIAQCKRRMSSSSGKLREPFLFYAPPSTVQGAVNVWGLVPSSHGVVVGCIGVRRPAASFYADLGQRQEEEGGVPLVLSTLPGSLKSQYQQLLRRRKIYGDPEEAINSADLAYGAELIRDYYKEHVIVYCMDIRSVRDRIGGDDLAHLITNFYFRLEIGGECIPYCGSFGLEDGWENYFGHPYIPEAVRMEQESSLFLSSWMETSEFIGSATPRKYLLCSGCGYPIYPGWTCGCDITAPRLRLPPGSGTDIPEMCWRYFLPPRIMRSLADLLNLGAAELYMEGLRQSYEDWIQRSRNAVLTVRPVEIEPPREQSGVSGKPRRYLPGVSNEGEVVHEV